MKNLILLASLFAGAAQAIEMPQSAKDMGCTNCHAIDHKVVGPSWMDVSVRYQGRNGSAALNQLVKTVSQGGYGEWGDLPMVPSDPTGVKRDRIVELVKFILSLSDVPTAKQPQQAGDKRHEDNKLAAATVR